MLRKNLKIRDDYQVPEIRSHGNYNEYTNVKYFYVCQYTYNFYHKCLRIYHLIHLWIYTNINSDQYLRLLKKSSFYLLFSSFLYRILNLRCVCLAAQYFLESLLYVTHRIPRHGHLHVQSTNDTRSRPQ